MEIFLLQTMPVDDMLAILRRANQEEVLVPDLEEPEPTVSVAVREKKGTTKKERKAERRARALEHAGGLVAKVTADAAPTIPKSTEPEPEEELLPSLDIVPYQIRHNVAVTVVGGDIEKALKRFKTLSGHVLFDLARGHALKTGGDMRRFNNNNWRTEPPELSGIGAALVRSTRKETWRALKEGRIPPSRRQRLRRLEQQRALVAARAQSSPAPSVATVEPVRIVEIPAAETVPVAPAVREEVLVIVEFLSDPLTYGVIWDQGKPKLGFVFGGKDDPDQGLVDQELHVAAEREAMEELFCGVNIQLGVTPQNMLGQIHGRSHGLISVFHVQVPSDTPVSKGDEQREAFAVSQVQLEQWIRDRMVLPQHIQGWEFFKQTVLLSRLLATI